MPAFILKSESKGHTDLVSEIVAIVKGKIAFSPCLVPFTLFPRTSDKMLDFEIALQFLSLGHSSSLHFNHILPYVCVGGVWSSHYTKIFRCLLRTFPSIKLYKRVLVTFSAIAKVRPLHRLPVVWQDL